MSKAMSKSELQRTLGVAVKGIEGLREALAAAEQRAEGAERERKLYWECYRRAFAVYRWMRGQEREALREQTQAVHEFVGRVNRRAEAEMQRTGTLEGAHHRAIEAELVALPKEEAAPRHPRHRNA